MSTANDTDAIATLASAIAAIAKGSHDEARELVAAVHTSLVNRNRQATLPGMPVVETASNRDDIRRQAVGRLFAYWQDRCEHRAAKLTTERARCIMARLRDGYTEAEIRKAIDGAAVAAFVNDENGQRYDDLTLICRNGSKLESFMERGVKATGAIAVELNDASPVEDRISELRRQMATFRRDGRTTEYSNAEAELLKLMAKRKAAT
jgi:hypothetical protein